MSYSMMQLRTTTAGQRSRPRLWRWAAATNVTSVAKKFSSRKHNEDRAIALTISKTLTIIGNVCKSGRGGRCGVLCAFGIWRGRCGSSDSFSAAPGTLRWSSEAARDRPALIGTSPCGEQGLTFRSTILRRLHLEFFLASLSMKEPRRFI